jgi:hypothetical protein
LFELPPDLRDKIYDAMSLTFHLNQTYKYTDQGVTLAKNLEKLLNEIIPQLEAYLKKRTDIS